MRKLSKTTLWICVAVALVIAGLLIYLCTVTSGTWNTIVIGLLTVDFIFLTFVVQIASFKSFTYKAKLKDYPQKDYSGDYDKLEEILIKKGYVKRETYYGLSFLKIKGKNAYKAVLVNDFIKYFDNTIEEEAPSKPNKQLEKCETFVAIEIFKEIDEANLVKLPDFSLQGKNVYYTALLNQGNGLLKCLNYVEPNETYKELVNNLLEDLEITEKVIND